MNTLPQLSESYYELPEWYTKDFEGKVFETQENLNEAIAVLEGISSNFEKLGGKTSDIFQKTKKRFDNSDDVRPLAFDHFLQHLACSRFLLDLYVFFLKGMEIPSLINEQTFSTPSLYATHEMVPKRLIYPLINEFYFTIENCLWTLQKALTNKDPGKSPYNKIMNDILDRLFSDAPDKKKIYSDALTVLNWARNTLHNNWVHVGESKTFQLGNLSPSLEFKFEKDKLIRFLSLGHIFVLLEKVIDSLEAIIFHPEVIKLKSEDCEERFAKSLKEWTEQDL